MEAKLWRHFGLLPQFLQLVRPHSFTPVSAVDDPDVAVPGGEMAGGDAANSWCHSPWDQLADLGEYRPGGNESAGVFQGGTAKARAAHDREDGPFSIGLTAAGFVVSRLRAK
jgi:hypothetical protein